MTRLLVVGALVALLAGLLAWALREPAPARPVQPLDTTRSHAILDSLQRLLASEARRSDSVRAYLDTAHPREVVRWLERRVPVRTTDTLRDTLPPDTVTLTAPLVRATADSLERCSFQRDSLRGDVALWKSRDQEHAEAVRLLQERPPVVVPDPPSRATWSAVGAAGALLVTASIIILGR